MQGQVQKQRCGYLSFVHNPDESDSCKAEGRERGEKGEEKGERREGREESRHRQRWGHTPCWESSRGYPGVLKQEAGAGVSLAPSLRREAQGSKRNLLESPALPTSLKATR